MGELSLMGFAEILPHLPRLLRRIGETAAAVERLRPDLVLTVDSPGFSFRVARRIRKLDIPIVHYVAPQLWAWRPGRGRKIAKLVDHILALLPFEPAFFKQFNVPCSFVGHSVLESGADRGDAAAFRARHGLAPEMPLVSVLPGSRRMEVTRLLPVFGAALARLAETSPGLVAAVSTVDTVADAVAAALEDWPVPTILVAGSAEKYDAFAASRAALSKSGTITLELAMARLPMVVAYKVSPLTAFFARRLIRVSHAALVNLLVERPRVPELLQEACTPEALAGAVQPLLEDGPARAAQLAQLDEAVRSLGGLSPTPSERAAEAVLRIIARAGSESEDLPGRRSAPARPSS
jgi:lipid-A-disaccharide synthase